MKLMDKVKSLFTEEVEVEEEIPKMPKREKIVDVEIPKREEIKVEPKEKQIISDTPVLTRDDRPKTPIYFDDKAFDDLITAELSKKEENRSNNGSFKKKSIEDAYKGNVVKEETKVFKPSPIISPVYGVLDRNYHKDDIKANDLSKPTVAVKKNSKNVDDIRNKAYGTLEDDLENTFLDSSFMKEDIFEPADDYETSKDDGIDIFEGLNTREARNSNVDLLREDYEAPKEEKEDEIALELERQKQKINEINEYIKNTKAMKSSVNLNNNLEEEQTNDEELVNEEVIEEPTEEEPIMLTKVEDNIELDEIKHNEEDNQNSEDGVESELFDLIDSMYEKRDEE